MKRIKEAHESHLLPHTKHFSKCTCKPRERAKNPFYSFSFCSFFYGHFSVIVCGSYLSNFFFFLNGEMENKRASQNEAVVFSENSISMTWLTVVLRWFFGRFCFEIIVADVMAQKMSTQAENYINMGPFAKTDHRQQINIIITKRCWDSVVKTFSPFYFPRKCSKFIIIPKFSAEWVSVSDGKCK